jgi:hypothetical protein
MLCSQETVVILTLGEVEGEEPLFFAFAFAVARFLDPLRLLKKCYSR